MFLACPEAAQCIGPRRPRSRHTRVTARRSCRFAYGEVRTTNPRLGGRTGRRDYRLPPADWRDTCIISRGQADPNALHRRISAPRGPGESSLGRPMAIGTLTQCDPSGDALRMARLATRSRPPPTGSVTSIWRSHPEDRRARGGRVPQPVDLRRLRPASARIDPDRAPGLRVHRLARPAALAGVKGRTRGSQRGTADL